MNEFEGLDNKALYDRIAQGDLARRLNENELGRMLQEAANRVAEKAIRDFALKVDIDNKTEVIKLQLIIRMYKYGLFDEIKRLAEDGESATQELEERRNYEDLDSTTGTGEEP